MNRLRHVQKCRICGNELTKILDLGSQYLQGSFCHPDKQEPSHRTIPLELMWCDTEKSEWACGAVQLSKTIPPDILYRDYWYVSATTEIMRNHLKSIVDYGINTILENDYMHVLDIAANDGTLLSNYPKAYHRYAIDPSNIVETILDKSINIIRDFFPSKQLNHLTFDIITSIAVLYDLDNPLLFMKNIAQALKTNGIWIFEMSYLPTMLQKNSFDTVCGEHIFYYSLSVIEYMLHQTGMKLINATLNDINGGSIQCTAVKKECTNYSICTENLSKLRMLEFDMALDTIEPYVDFRYTTNQICRKLHNMIYELVKEQGKTVHLYGASTKGNTLLQACDIDNNLIPYAAERSPSKFGAKTLGTNIQIISEEESRSMKPDAFLVLPWHFKNEILIRETQTMVKGTKMIFPLPEIKIYPGEVI